jgi:hypothetical protein
VSDGFSGAHLDLMDGRADLPRFGAVIKGPSLSLPYVVTDAAGREVEPVSGYLRDLQLVDRPGNPHHDRTTGQPEDRVLANAQLFSSVAA